MSRALLDTNVLLALLDDRHLDHSRARSWIDAEIRHGWASCAITQNGFVRVISQPRYPNSVPPADAIARLAEATRSKHHQFWPCAVAVTDSAAVDASRLRGHQQVTDVYLLALAVAHDGRFVTLDRAVEVGAVPNASATHLVVL